MSRIGKIRKGPFLILPIRTTPPGRPASAAEAPEAPSAAEAPEAPPAAEAPEAAAWSSVSRGRPWSPPPAQAPCDRLPLAIPLEVLPTASLEAPSTDSAVMSIPFALAPVSHEWAPGGGTQPAARPAGPRTSPAAPAARARGSMKREDKDSLTVGSLTALRRLARRREDKNSLSSLTVLPRRGGSHGGGGRGACGAPCPPSRGRRCGSGG